MASETLQVLHVIDGRLSYPPSQTGLQRISVAQSPPTAPSRPRRLPAPPEQAEPRQNPSRGRDTAASPARSRLHPAGNGLQQSVTRMRRPLSPGDSSSHLDDHVSATCPSRSLLVLDSSCRFSPPPARLLPQAPLGPPQPPTDSLASTDTSLTAWLPLPASIVCRAVGRGRGEEEGGRQRSGGSAPRTTGPEAGKVGAVPPPCPGSGVCPRRPVPHAASQRPATASPAPST